MQTLDIPQANDLDTVRRVLYAVSRGAKSLEAIADFTGYSHRHTQYRVHAARILALLHLEGDEAILTTLGERILDAEKGSQRERELYARAINACPVIQIVAPDLLGPNPPLIEELTDRLFHQSKLAPDTARRRASGLLAWRRHVLGETAERAPRHPAADPPPPPPAPAPEPSYGPTSKAQQLSLL
ncbi:MAG: hypothetical protein R3F65_13065 [bacterium]